MKQKRKLKVEPQGWQYPKGEANGAIIRLKGQWLKRLGFMPGHTVELNAISPGVLEIRLCIKPLPDAAFAIAAQRLDNVLQTSKA